MFADLTNIPTEILEDMVFAMVKEARLLTCEEIAELNQIERELRQRSRRSYEQD